MKNKIIIVACLVLVLAMALILPYAVTYADYVDVVSNPDSIVNFNQLSNWYSMTNSYYNFGGIDSSGFASISLTNTSITWAKIRINSTNNPIDPLNKVYIRYYCKNGDYDITLANMTTNTTTLLYNSGDSIILTGGSDYRFDMADFFGSNSSGTCYVSLILIDLTSMFGAGNEPTLEQCNVLFVADYYPYNTGSTLSLSGLSSYVDGYNNALSSFSIIESSSDIIDSIYKVNARNFEKLYNASSGGTSVLLQDGVMGIPVGFTLSPNDVVTFNISRMTLPDYNPNGTTPPVPFDVGYLSGGNFVSIASYSYQDFSTTTFNGLSYYTGSFTITIPVSTNAIYVRISGSNSSGTYYNMTWYNFTLSIRSINLYSAITEGVNNGISEAKAFYNTYYSVGGAGYNQIYNLGKTAGINETNPFTFGNLMTAVVESPINAVLQMFNFDFLGYNFKNVITLIITLCIILAIVRLFIGMGASE